MGWFPRFAQMKRDAARARDAEAQAFILLDQMRQIEWRLAMCRSCAVDVRIAHAIAFEALDAHHAEPCMSSASRYAVEKNRTMAGQTMKRGNCAEHHNHVSSTNARDTLVQSRDRRNMASRLLSPSPHFPAQGQSGERE